MQNQVIGQRVSRTEDLYQSQDKSVLVIDDCGTCYVVLLDSVYPDLMGLLGPYPTRRDAISMVEILLQN